MNYAFDANCVCDGCRASIRAVVLKPYVPKGTSVRVICPACKKPQTIVSRVGQTIATIPADAVVGLIKNGGKKEEKCD
jgi:hypothetical protein